MATRIHHELESMYFRWLSDLVNNKNHWRLMRYLHSIEYFWVNPYDENRAEDGRNLRNRFNWEGNFNVKYEMLPDRTCSVLEFIIGVASRLNGMTVPIGKDEITDSWFWMLLDNLSLYQYEDEVLVSDERFYDVIDTKIDILLNRKYGYDGHGGLFPLDSAKENQRDLEVWYQMSQYIMEKGIY